MTTRTVTTPVSFSRLVPLALPALCLMLAGIAGCPPTPPPGPATCESNEDCDDGRFCNGEETCQTGACTPSAPLVCDDGDQCTTDVCDATRGCQFPEIEDFDGIECLCGVGLAASGCVAPGSVAGQFSKGCALAARATDATARKQRPYQVQAHR